MAHFDLVVSINTLTYVCRVHLVVSTTPVTVSRGEHLELPSFALALLDSTLSIGMGFLSIVPLFTRLIVYLIALLWERVAYRFNPWPERVNPCARNVLTIAHVNKMFHLLEANTRVFRSDCPFMRVWQGCRKHRIRISYVQAAQVLAAAMCYSALLHVTGHCYNALL
jgi:hypothetical protein